MVLLCGKSKRKVVPTITFFYGNVLVGLVPVLLVPQKYLEIFSGLSPGPLSHFQAAHFTMFATANSNSSVEKLQEHHPCRVPAVGFLVGKHKASPCIPPNGGDGAIYFPLGGGGAKGAFFCGPSPILGFESYGITFKRLFNPKCRPG